MGSREGTECFGKVSEAMDRIEEAMNEGFSYE